jgi:hypothetical protein
MGSTLPLAFDQATIDRICQAAATSAIAGYQWRDRGRAPAGYVQGMAVAFAQAVRRLEAGDPVAAEMSKADTHNDDLDALSWYRSNLTGIGMSCAAPGIDTLRALYVLLLGLGMRESSGKHCEGVDQSAANHESETAECGSHQTSWNIHTCSTLIDDLFAQYEPALGEDDVPQCYLDVFKQGVSCSSASWKCWGSGQGKDYQQLSKECPTFHVEVTAIGLRRRRQHWGPINNKAAEVRADSNELFLSVQQIVSQPPQPSAPGLMTITIDPPGSMRVIVTGAAE